ncbi:MAG TPA: AAA family ATPase [Pyrinomonadaceae bacterium]|nr:AAA family ATPase [Pyrinomonadaceae bacterium]
MIRRARINNYKSLKSAEVRFPNLTVIIGPNAAGKSNLLDALNLVSKLVTSKNIKEAFEGHRGLPLESVYYSKGSLAELLSEDTHRMEFEIDVELSDIAVQETEQRVRDLRKGIDDKNGSGSDRLRITERFLRYKVALEIQSRSGVMRVMDESLAALRRDGEEKARKPFLEKVGNRLSLRMEGQAHPTMHEIGLDYTLASTSLYPPHYPHLTALREEMSRCRFYYFEPRALMREANAIADVSVLGPRGEELAAFYHTLSLKRPKQMDALKLTAKQLLPRLTNIDVESTDKAELFLRVWEDGASYSNRLISEGTLRVLGLLAVLSPTSGSTTIGYEEPENGVHPRRLSQMAELLKNAANKSRQIIVNTHSPILPTYFRNDNLLVCRRTHSSTEFIPFKSIGPLYRDSEIASHLEEQIIRGDYGG